MKKEYDFYVKKFMVSCVAILILSGIIGVFHGEGEKNSMNILLCLLFIGILIYSDNNKIGG